MTFDRDDVDRMDSLREAVRGMLDFPNPPVRGGPHPLDIPFVDTSVSFMIFDMIERAAALQGRGNGIIIGEPGIGKTRVLKEALRRANAFEGTDVAYVKVEAEYAASTMALFEEIAPHLGVRAGTSIAATMRRLTKEARFRPVMLFDEAQNLTLKSARSLLSISEEGNIPMIFVGNADVLKLVNSQQAAIQQIARRLPFREKITCITDEDADRIAAEFGLEEMESFRICRRIGAALHADGIVQVLQEARRAAGGEKTLRPPHVSAALATFPHFVQAVEAVAGPRLVPARQATAGSRSISFTPVRKLAPRKGGAA